jgi:hypothetical protein
MIYKVGFMKRILIFGDSHISQLLTSSKLLKCKEVEFIFITGPGPISKKFYFSEYKLCMEDNDGIWPDTSNQPGINVEKFNKWYVNSKEDFLTVAPNGTLDLRELDGVIIYGGHLVKQDWFKYFNIRLFYSQNLLFECIEESVASTNHLIWLTQLKDFIAQGGLVHSIPPPLFNVKMLENLQDSNLVHNMRKALTPDTSFLDVEHLYKKIVERQNSHFIPLPRVLYSEDGWGTHSMYKSKKELDFTHLNQEGGAVLLNYIISFFRDEFKPRNSNWVE